MKRVVPGDIILVPLSSVEMCFGQVLTHGSLLVFDFCTDNRFVDIDDITSKRRLCRVMIDEDMSRGYWEKIGHSQIPPDLVTVKFYKASSRAPDLYDLIIDGNIAQRAVAKQAVLGLPYAEIWNPEWLEERLGYYFRGENDPWDESNLKLGFVLT